jgi:hypothetical protein
MNKLLVSTTVALSLGLAACGGSSSSEETPTLTTLQGLWRSPAGTADTMSAIVLPDGKVWALDSKGGSTRMIKSSFTVQDGAYSASGKSYTLGTGASSSLSMTASAVEKFSMTGAINQRGGSGTQSENFNLTYQSRYETAARLADFAGTWRAALGPGTVNWSVGPSGVIDGTRTTGCTYSGQLTLREEKRAVVDVTLTERCAATETPLNGVVVMSEDRSNLVMLLTTNDESAAVALNLVR